jgi:hypothetical protein
MRGADLTKRRHLAALAVLVALGAGCGDDDSDKDKEDAGAGGGASAAEVNRQDAAAKANARSLVTELEVCYVDQQSYSACKEPSETELTLGSGPGEVEVSETTDAGFTVVAHSESGTNFEIVKDEGGSLSRSCDKEGEGGCKSGGVW